ncbi:MAG: UDP-N-acetylglucosamine 2-epimerase [Leptospiraceae bacterium]
MRKICVVTGSRAEYGLLYWLMKGIQGSEGLEFQLIVTGMHLSPEFGLTYQQIEDDGFEIDRKVEMLLSADTPTAVSKSTALGLIGMADALADLTPDLLVVLGDRFEIFAAATAATLQRVPLAHIHGGESTFGAVDEAIRHSITKMSHLHFTATEVYRNRVIQLGEDPSRVFNVGAVGLDNIQRLDFLEIGELEQSLGVSLEPDTVLVTYHPVTLESATAKGQIEALLKSLDLARYQVIFTLPNADADGRIIRDCILKFAAEHPDRVKAFTSLGQLKYLSLLKYVSIVVGNSSSGILEVPAFGIPTINIGDRQAGRIAAKSVIHCGPDSVSIESAIEKGFNQEFRESLAGMANPYGSGGATEKIQKILEEFEIEGILKKRFFDLPPAVAGSQAKA